MSLNVQTIKAFLQKQGCRFDEDYQKEIQDIYLGFLENTNQGITLLKKTQMIRGYSKVSIQEVTSKFLNASLNIWTPDQLVKGEMLKFTFKLQKVLEAHGVKCIKTQLDRIVQDLKISNQQSLIKLLRENNMEQLIDKDTILELIAFKDFEKNMSLIWKKKYIENPNIKKYSHQQMKKILHSDGVKLVQLDIEDNSKKIRKTQKKLYQHT